MNPLQKKSLVISIVLAIEFLLLALMPTDFSYIFVAIIITLLGAWYYNFDIRLSKKEWLVHNSRFLILPVLFNLGAAFFIASFFQDATKVVMALIVGLINYYLFIALRRVHNLADKAAIFQRNIIISVAFVSVFLSLSALFRFYVSYSISADFKLPQSFVVVITGLIFFMVSHFLAWENGLDLKKFSPYNLVSALVGAEIAWICSIWIVNYPVIGSSEKANLGGSPLPAIALTIVFYLMWGVISHKADKSLTKNIILEYVFLSFMFLFILILTARWLPSI
jgi:hypothetical protein